MQRRAAQRRLGIRTSGQLPLWKQAAVPTVALCLLGASSEGLVRAEEAQPADSKAAPAVPSTPVTIAERPLEVSLIVGAHFFSSTAALGRSDYAAPGSDLRHSAAIGARIGYGLSRHFLLEGEFVAMPTQLAEKPAQVRV